MNLYLPIPMKKLLYKNSLAFLFLFILFLQGNSLLGQIPTITSFTPSSAVFGASVTINGSNFSTTPSNNIVYFGGARATVTGATATQLTVTVPAGSTSVAPITVVNLATGTQASSMRSAAPALFTLRYTNPLSISASSFVANNLPITTPINGAADGVSIGDFNNDGRPDIAVGINDNTGAGNLLIFLKNAGVGFTEIARGNINTLFNKKTIVADFDNDGNLDIAIKGTSTNNILQIFLNSNGLGDFSSAPVETNVATSSSVMSVEHFNNDGFIDIICGGRLYLGNGDGTFTFASSITGTSNDIASLNADNVGSIDVFATQGTNVARFLGSGTGGFGPAANYPAGVSTGDMTIGLFTGSDNFLDVVVSDYFDNKIVLMENNAAVLGTPTNITATDPRGHTTVDLNGDGLHDVLSIRYGTGRNTQVFLNNGTTLNTPVVFTTSSSAGTGTATFGAADFNGDGFIDFVSSSTGSNIFINYYTPPAPFISTATGGNWNAATTWVGGTVPTAGSDVIIATTGTNKVNVNVNNISINSLQVNQGAILDFGTTTYHTINELTTNATVGQRIIRFAQGTLPTVSSSNTFLTNLGAGIEFYGATNYNIPPTFGLVDYQNVIIQGTGIKSLSGATTVNSNLVVESGATLELGINNFTVNGTTTINSGSTINDGSNGGTNTFNGNFTNGGNFTATGLSTFNFTGNNAYSNTGTISLGINTITLNSSTSSTFTNSGTMNLANIVGTATGGTENLINNGTITVTGTGAMFENLNLDFDNIPNTIEYAGTTATPQQQVATTNYNNVTLSGNRAKTLHTGDITVTGNWLNSITGTGIFTTSPAITTFSGINDATIEGTISGGTSAKVVIAKTGGSKIILTTRGLSGNAGASLELVSGMIDNTVNGTVFFDGYIGGSPTNYIQVPVGGGITHGSWPENLNVTYNFPIGTSTYTPISFLRNSPNNAIIRVTLNNTGTPALPSTSANLNLQWEVQSTQANTILSDITFGWQPANVTGTIAGAEVQFHNGTDWTALGGAASAGSVTAASSTTLINAGTNRQFTVFIPATPSNPFITTWVATGGEITIPTTGTGYNYDITWTNISGTGGDDFDTNVGDGNYLISGLTDGDTYEIAITGDFPRIFFDNTGDKDKILTIEQWGDIQWTGMFRAFYGCSNLTTIGGGASNVPDLSGVTNMTQMFHACTSFTGNSNMNNWNTTNVTSMENVFQTATAFNQNISGWNTENVTNMLAMFYQASSFNNGGQPLNWNTSVVGNMRSMFNGANSFNQDISGWNTSAVTTMRLMFNGANVFNQNLGGWDINNVADMTGMLSGCNMNTVNYDATLTGWAAQTVKSNVNLGANGRIYCNAVAERNTLTSAPNNWVITNDAVDASCLPTQPVGNRGLYFDGVDDQIIVPNTFNSLTTFTYEAWIKPQNIDSGRPFQHFMGDIVNRAFYLRKSDRTINFFMDHSFGTRVGVQSNAPVVENEWIHVAATFDGSFIRMYINGLPQTNVSIDLSGVTFDPVNNLLIGGGINEWFSGQLDEVRIFESARDANQIQADMATSTPNDAVAFWRFEYGEEQTAFNSGLLFSMADGTLGSTAGADANDPLWALRVKNTDDSGAESLRDVITTANGLVGKNYIDFSIDASAPWNISLLSNINGFDGITESVIVDGTSQFGWQENTTNGMVTISRNASNMNAYGLIISGAGASDVEVYGLHFTGFPRPLRITTGADRFKIGDIGKGNVINQFSGVAGIEVFAMQGSITGNKIGTNEQGTILSTSTGTTGILLSADAATTTIEKNIIAGSNLILGSNDNTVENNKIGTGITGNETGFGITSGTAYNGIEVRGNASMIKDNIIGKFSGSGIQITTAATNNILNNNKIGVGNDGVTNLSNSQKGIWITTSAGNSNTIINNIIANNAQEGILVDNSQQNRISRNSIYQNTDGIILSNGGNADKQAPTITSATTTTITGTCGESTDIIEVFKNNTGETQGRTYLGNATVSGTDWTYTGSFTTGDNITATATDGTTGDTSPFSNAQPVVGETITLGTIDPTTYCAGETINVPFTTVGSFNGGNTFTAELSDASGSFASPIATQTGTSPISLVIPAGASTSTAYRVRIVSSDPVVTSDESAAITINATPTVNLSVSSTTGSEAASTEITVTATASSAVSGDQTVDLDVTGTGITTEDYILSNTTITISDGNTTGSVTFTVVDDTLTEGDETAILTISSPSSCVTLGTITSKNIVITDNDLREINVTGNGNDIVSGSTTPSTTNDTDFGSVLECNTNTIVKTFTIQNTGTANLSVSNITSTGTDAADFVLGGLPTFPATIAASGSQTFTVTFNPSATGNRTALVTISNNDSDEGTYTFAISGNGLADNTNPVIPTLANVTAQCEVALLPIPTTTDNCSGTITGTTTQTFPITTQGTTVVTWTFTDAAGNSVTANQNVIIDDTTNPVIPTLANATVSPNQGCAFYNTNIQNPSYIADGTATDNCGTVTYEYVLTDATIGIVSTLEYQVFNEGETTVTWKAIDASGNESIVSSFTVTVVDSNQPPILTPLQNVTRNTDPTNCYYTNRTTTTSTRIPNGTATDNCGVASYRYLLSGATLGDVSSLESIRFNKGVTNVSWTATDRNGNTSAPSQFMVTVTDTQNPVIEAPQAITRTTNLYGCTSTRDSLNIGTPTVTDNCLFRVFNDAPAEFPIGETIVTWTAVDSAGNRATDEQIVTIEEQFFVAPSDSLILVQMYNEMGGASWNRSWDLNTPVSTWSGIGVRCGNVASINLSNNNLTGVLPTSVLNLARRTESDFSLHIGGNRLSFESAEDFVGLVPNFTYSPQANIYASRSERVRQTESITFNSQTEGNFNNYQWYKDQTPIAGATNWNYTITSAVPSDAGIYVCQVTNTVANRLTIERNPITLEVAGFVNPTDSLALVTIFEETGGPTTWIRPWILTDPIATWEGVTIVGDKVRELDLSSRNMRGVLPNVFDDDFFSELRYLSFFDNNLEGQIPVSIGAITTLTYLDLDKNQFEGSVPASFGELINLQSLWLSRNNLTSLPNEIGNMVGLRTLYLNDNKFTSLPETIGNLSELLVLNVSDNELLGLPNSITNLRKLVQFYANRNYISALPPNIQNLVALTVFEINTNNLTALPNEFLQLSSLSRFRVSENELEFDDLLPYSNQTYSVFDYAPQAPINEEEDILAILNSSISFTVQTQGNGNNYQWFRNGTSIATTQTLTINRVNNNDAGLYTAQITNPSLPDLTLQRRSIRLNVECQEGQNFEIQQPTQNVFCEGQPFGLRLEINDQLIDTQQIRWKKDGVVLAFANERTYTVTGAGVYTAEILTTNGCTALSNPVEITVLPQPEVTISLVNEEVFESTLNSQESVTYQWLKDGVAIEGAFERTYTPTQTGEYSLLVLTESGCSSVSETIIFTQDEVTGIKEPKEFRNLAIFPNPNNGNFFVDFGTTTPNGEPSFILIDAIGRKINLKTERISSTRYKVNTTNLTGGMYYLQIQTKDGLAFRKFVIEE